MNAAIGLAALVVIGAIIVIADNLIFHRNRNKTKWIIITLFLLLPFKSNKIDKIEISKHILQTEKLLLAKRNQLFAIQKENSMTIQGMLRAVPKQQLEVDEIDDPMEDLLKRRK